MTEIYDCSAAPEHERLEIDNGAIWTEDMARTLERLDALCARRATSVPRQATSARLTIVFAELQSAGGSKNGRLSIRKLVRTARRYRTIEIQVGQHSITAASPCPTTCAGHSE